VAPTVRTRRYEVTETYALIEISNQDEVVKRISQRMGHNNTGVTLDHKKSLVIPCEEGDSNPHRFPYQILSLARLPVPPSSRESFDNLPHPI
jgi:hypothetical protein